MKLPEAIKILEIHNKWRHRDDLEMTNPKKLGEATALAVEILKAIEDPWISVEERLPKSEDDMVLLFDSQGCTYTGYLHGIKSGFITYGEEAYKVVGKVTHWMSLPKPPKQ